MSGGVRKPRGDISDQKLFFFFLATLHTACGILLLRPGTEPTVPAVEARSPDHYAAREVPVQRCWRKSSPPKQGPRREAKQCFVWNTRMVAMTGGQKVPYSPFGTKPARWAESTSRWATDWKRQSLSEAGWQKFCIVVGLKVLPSAGRERMHSSQELWTVGKFCTLPIHEEDLYAGDLGSIPGLGRSPGGGNCNPL